MKADDVIIMQYKLVAIDIDGTLLNSRNEIPAENIQTIRELRQRGVRFVVVTGRPDVMAREYVNILGINAPILGCNGATMRDALSGGETYYCKSIPLQPLTELYNYFQTAGLFARYYGLDTVYSFNPHEFDEQRNPFAHFSKQLAKHMDFKVIAGIDELIASGEKIIKLMYPVSDPELLKPVQQQLRLIDGVEVFRASKLSLDIVATGISKGVALLDYALSLGIDRSELVAIGDSENDLSMLQAVGLPVAMGNASDGVKSICALVTASNDDAGVSKALREIFAMELLSNRIAAT